MARESDLVPDPLPSWNAGAAKRALLDFGAAVTRVGGPQYVPADDRVAVFDNDGTLWCEQPMYVQAAFALSRVAALVEQRPELRERQPYKAVLERDAQALAAEGERGIFELLNATHTGMTTSEFDELASHWLQTALHPRFQRPYTELVYQPMLELLAWLRSLSFQCFVVSAGGADFMRQFTRTVYDLPPARVVGSTAKLAFEGGEPGGAPRPIVRLRRLPGVDFVDDGAGKPVGIHRFVGQRPLLAFGNSDGDLEMLQYTAAGEGAGPRLMLLLHHDDAAREYAYDREARCGRLDRALGEARARGFIVVSMKNDFGAVFAPSSSRKGD
jgi:phosphoglycolate phosphatase-like HAD superfamily hydrolase